MTRESAMTHEGAIAAAVEEALASDPATTPHRIGVAAVGTTVTLRGYVPSLSAKRRAERVARGVSGVMDVTSELEITPGSAFGVETLGLSLLAAAGADARDGGGGVGAGGLAAAQVVGATGKGLPAGQDLAEATDAGPLNDWEG